MTAPATSAALPTATAADRTARPARWTEDTQRLFARYHMTRDPRLRDALVERFMPLARRLAHRYRRPGRDTGEELEQVAALGLVLAVDRFDPSRGFAFASFATPTILGELRRHFRDTGWAVHVPRSLQEAVLLVEKTAQKLSTKTGRAPSVREIAEASGLGEETVLEALSVQRAATPDSLDATTGGDEDEGRTLGERIGGEDGGFELAEYGACVRECYARFTERERLVLRLRFGEDLTQSEIGARIGVSQMQVSRILRKLLDELRAAAAE